MLSNLPAGLPRGQHTAVGSFSQIERDFCPHTPSSQTRQRAFVQFSRADPALDIASARVIDEMDLANPPGRCTSPLWENLDELSSNSPRARKRECVSRAPGGRPAVLQQSRALTFDGETSWKSIRQHRILCPNAWPTSCTTAHIYFYETRITSSPWASERVPVPREIRPVRSSRRWPVPSTTQCLIYPEPHAMRRPCPSPRLRMPGG